MDQSRSPRTYDCVCESPICPYRHRVPRAGRTMGFLAPAPAVQTSLEDELAEYRRRHQAHPMDRAMDGEFDALADLGWDDDVLADRLDRYVGGRQLG